MGISAKAYAKINLSLDVIGKRDDGYHEVEMIMQSVSIYDELTFFPSPVTSLTTSDPLLPIDEKNLVLKAVRVFKEYTGITDEVRIFLQKRIPVGAGLGGGSADAAATLHALNRLWEAKLSPEELRRLAVSIGADVSFGLIGGTALARGIGEEITRLPPLPPVRVLLAKPPFSVDTGFVYQSLIITSETRHPKTKDLIRTISKGDIWKGVSFWGNLLEDVTLKRHPEVGRIIERLKEEGLPARMSGSGPTVFALLPEGKDISKLRKALAPEGWWWREGRFVQEGIEIRQIKEGEWNGKKAIDPD